MEHNCHLCNKPETIEHVFIDCWSGVFFWDILQRTLKKELPLSPHGIRFLSVKNEAGVPYDLIMLLGLHSIWKTRCAFENADVEVLAVRQYFCKSVCHFLEMLKSQEDVPDWIGCIERLLRMPKY